MDAFFNKHFSKGKNVVENVLGILKKTFKKLLFKNNLHIVFLPNFVACTSFSRCKCTC
jgi:hypothetical protein